MIRVSAPRPPGKPKFNAFDICRLDFTILKVMSMSSLSTLDSYTASTSSYVAALVPHAMYTCSSV